MIGKTLIALAMIVAATSASAANEIIDSMKGAIAMWNIAQEALCLSYKDHVTKEWRDLAEGRLIGSRSIGESGDLSCVYAYENEFLVIHYEPTEIIAFRTNAEDALMIPLSDQPTDHSKRKTALAVLDAAEIDDERERWATERFVKWYAGNQSDCERVLSNNIADYWPDLAQINFSLASVEEKFETGALSCYFLSDDDGNNYTARVMLVFFVHDNRRDLRATWGYELVGVVANEDGRRHERRIRRFFDK